MAWIYLAESEDSLLPWQIGLDRLPIVNKIDTVKRSCCLGCKTVAYPTPDCGMTCEPLTPRNFIHQLILSTEDSHARTLVLQEMESDWRVSEAGFSMKLQGLSKKQTRDLYFSKMSQQLEHGASIKSSTHLPSSGMIVDGQLFQPKKLAPVTLEKGGSYLPTPIVSQKSYDKQSNGTKTYSLSGIASHGMLPTPTATNYGYNQSEGLNAKRRASLQSMAARCLMPTPKSPYLPHIMGGTLNPQFVEEIMGYPLGWTELKDWAIQWYRSKQEKRL